jgi:hypothetical protein
MRYRRNPDAEKAKKVAYIEAIINRLKVDVHPVALYQLGDDFLSYIAKNLYEAASIAGLEIKPYGTRGMDEFMMKMAETRPWFSQLDDTKVSRPKNFMIPSALQGSAVRKNPRRKKRNPFPCSPKV